MHREDDLAEDEIESMLLFEVFFLASEWHERVPVDLILHRRKSEAAVKAQWR